MAEPIELANLALAAGAIGTASFGLVDALKTYPNYALIGVGRVERNLKFLFPALEVAYGPRYLELLRDQYRVGRDKGELPKTLRQGTRIGLIPDTAEGLANGVGVVSAKDLTDVARAVTKMSDGKLTDKQKTVLGRFELALDARIRAELDLAAAEARNWRRSTAAIIAVALAVVGGGLLHGKPYGDYIGSNFFWLNALVGLAAIPLAPVAKDVATALQTYAKSMRPAK